MTGGDQAEVFIFTAFSDSTTCLAGRGTNTGFKPAQASKTDLHRIDAKTATPANDDAFTFTTTSTFTLPVPDQVHVCVVNAGTWSRAIPTVLRRPISGSF